MKRLFLFIFFLVLLSGFIAYRYLYREQAVAVSVKTAEQGIVEQTVTNTRAGSVKARQRARLAPAIGGRIATLNVRKGDKVEAGQLLLTLWNNLLAAGNDARFCKSKLIPTLAFGNVDFSA